jgi:sortase A
MTEHQVEQRPVPPWVVEPEYSGTAVADSLTTGSTNFDFGRDFELGEASGVAEGDGRVSPSAKSTRPSFRRAELIGLSVTVGSLLLVMFLLYLYLFSGLTGARNQDRLLHVLTSDPIAVYSLATGHPAYNAEPVAVLDIPALELHEAVVEGTSAADLQLGPGLVSGTKMPGEPGNAIIVGRRVSFGGPFAGIGGLRPGNQIRVADGAGNFRFSVVSVTAISKSSFSAPVQSRSWLTLVTSNSPWLPSAKVVVMAKIIGPPVVIGKASSGAAPASYTLPNLGGDPASGILAGLWALALVGVLVLMVLSIRRWRQPWISWLLAAPVLLTCGLFACESLARCLPSTL